MYKVKNTKTGQICRSMREASKVTGITSLGYFIRSNKSDWVIVSGDHKPYERWDMTGVSCRKALPQVTEPVSLYTDSRISQLEARIDALTDSNNRLRGDIQALIDLILEGTAGPKDTIQPPPASPDYQYESLY